MDIQDTGHFIVKITAANKTGVQKQTKQGA